MKFGEKVRDLRKKHSLTQDELAQCLGINKRTIIGWERDGRYPRSVEMLEKMADIFHVPLTYLQPDQSLFIERAAEAYGKKGKIEAQHLAFELTELFASGELTPQDMDGIMYEMHKAYECGERCYPYSWKSGLYLHFAEERSAVYCNYAMCCRTSNVL